MTEQEFDALDDRLRTASYTKMSINHLRNFLAETTRDLHEVRIRSWNRHGVERGALPSNDVLVLQGEEATEAIAMLRALAERRIAELVKELGAL